MVSRNSSRKKVACLTTSELSRLLAEEKNGKPNYGAILHYFRLLAGWTAERLALLYSEALGLADNEPVSPSWIYMMESQNMVPIDEKRRWILARLLDIPPALFGLKALSSTPSRQSTSLFNRFNCEKINVVEYRSTLGRYCSSIRSGKVTEAVPDIARRIRNLEHGIPRSRGFEQKHVSRLLCEYSILLAYTAHEQQQFKVAIALLSDVIDIADVNKFYDIWAYALRARGVAHGDRGELTAGLVDFAAAKQDFEAATRDFDTIKTLENHLSPLRKGQLWLAAGWVYAHVAQDQASLQEALGFVDRGKKMLEGDGDNLIVPAGYDDMGRAYLNRGMILTVSPLKSLHSPAQAHQAFEHVLQSTPPTFTRRRLEVYMRQAEAYYVQGSYEMAVAYADQALDLVKRTDVVQYLTRLNTIYSRLKESPFGKSSEVATFGVKLLKVQHPELFA